MELFSTELCEQHQQRLSRLMKRNNTPLEAIRLYYGLKQAGVSPMLEWWDGTKSVHIAFSRIKLNIEVDTKYEMLSHDEALTALEETMCSFKNGFTTIRIPQSLIKHYLKDTVQNILGIIVGIRQNIKVV